MRSRGLWCIGKLADMASKKINKDQRARIKTFSSTKRNGFLFENARWIDLIHTVVYLLFGMWLFGWLFNFIIFFSPGPDYVIRWRKKTLRSFVYDNMSNDDLFWYQPNSTYEKRLCRYHNTPFDWLNGIVVYWWREIQFSQINKFLMPFRMDEVKNSESFHFFVDFCVTGSIL